MCNQGPFNHFRNARGGACLQKVGAMQALCDVIICTGIHVCQLTTVPHGVRYEVLWKRKPSCFQNKEPWDRILPIELMRWINIELQNVERHLRSLPS